MLDPSQRSPRYSRNQGSLPCQIPPAETKAEDHPAANFERSKVGDVSSFGNADARVKRNGTLEHGEFVTECNIHEMAVELQIHIRIQEGHDSIQRVSPNDFVGRADIGECAFSEMLEFEKLAGEEVSVIHEGGQLSAVSAQLFHDAGAVDDFGMRQIGLKLV